MGDRSYGGPLAQLLAAPAVPTSDQVVVPRGPWYLNLFSEGGARSRSDRRGPRDAVSQSHVDQAAWLHLEGAKVRWTRPVAAIAAFPIRINAVSSAEKGSPMKKGTRISIALGALFVLGLVSVCPAWAGPRDARETGRQGGDPAPCGPPTAHSLARSGGMRIFRLPETDERGYGVVRVCSRSSGSVLGLGQKLIAAPFVIEAPWAGAVEYRNTGQDSAEVFAVGVDILTGRRTDCAIGGANRPGQLPKVDRLWVTSDGSLVATVVRHLEPRGPEIVACSGSTLQVLAQGEAVRLSSVEVKGPVVSWSEGGEKNSRRV